MPYPNRTKKGDARIHRISTKPPHGNLLVPNPTGRNDDWRTQLSPNSRRRMVNKMMETLTRCLPISSPEGLQELQIIAVRFEEKVHTASTSLSDYLRKISLKTLTIVTIFQTNGATSSLPSTSAGSN